MPVGFNIDVQYDALKHTLSKIKNHQGVSEGMRDGADYFARQLAKYPPERHGKAIWSRDPEKRKRQIRGFFYLLRNGLITVPYQRRNELAKGWRVRMRDNGLTWAAVNEVAYASLVQGRKRTRYHELTNWKTPSEVWQRDQHAIKNRIGRGINKMIGKGE